jgi:Mrr N-terminal domain
MHLLCLSGLDSPTLFFGTMQTLRSRESMSALGDVAEVAQTTRVVLMVESLPAGAAARSPAGAALAMPVASVQFRVSQAARRCRNQEGRWRSQISIPDYQTLMLPLLKRAALGEMRVLEAEKQMGEEFGLTPEERAQLLPSGKQRVLHNRAHWAKFYLMKAGLVRFPSRGKFVATDAGRALLDRNPGRIDVDLLRQYPSFEEFYRGDHADPQQIPAAVVVPTASSALPPSTPEEQIEKAFLTIQSALRTELLQRISQNTPAPFEELIIELLVTMGYGGSRPDAAAQLGRSKII